MEVGRDGSDYSYKSTELEFLDVNLKKKINSFAPCYSQSFFRRIFKEKPDSTLVVKIYTKNSRNKKTRVYS